MDTPNTLPPYATVTMPSAEMRQETAADDRCTRVVFEIYKRQMESDTYSKLSHATPTGGIPELEGVGER